MIPRTSTAPAWAEMKLCKDCKHCRVTDLPVVGNYVQCRRHGMSMDPVDGSPVLANPRNCYDERNFINGCGPDAKYWEPR